MTAAADDCEQTRRYLGKRMSDIDYRSGIEEGESERPLGLIAEQLDIKIPFPMSEIPKKRLLGRMVYLVKC